MDRKTFDAIRRKRQPHGDEVLHFLEGQGFRLTIPPGHAWPRVTFVPQSAGLPAMREAQALIEQYGKAIYEAMKERKKLYEAVNWGGGPDE